MEDEEQITSGNPYSKIYNDYAVLKTYLRIGFAELSSRRAFRRSLFKAFGLGYVLFFSYSFLSYWLYRFLKCIWE